MTPREPLFPAIAGAVNNLHMPFCNAFTHWVARILDKWLNNFGHHRICTCFFCHSGSVAVQMWASLRLHMCEYIRCLAQIVKSMEFSRSNRPVSGYHHHKAASSPSQYSAGCIPTEYHAFQSFKTSKANCTNRFVPPTYSNQIQYWDPKNAKIWFKVHLKFYFLLPCMSTLPLPSGV